MIPINKNSIASVYFSKENVAVAFYNNETTKIKCGQITSMTYLTTFTLHQILKQEINPDLVISNQDKHPAMLLINEQVQVMKINERGLEDEVIENNLGLFRTNAAGTAISSKENYIKLMMEQSQRLSGGKQKFKALGMLIYYLLNEANFSIVQKVYLNDISFFFDEIFKHVQITIPELQGLQITKEEVHPSLIKGKGRSKQGFSILNYYQTPLISSGSKKILRSILRNPTFNVSILSERLKVQRWIKQKLNGEESMKKIFNNLHSMDRILNKFEQVKAENEDWRKLVKTIESMLILQRILSERVRRCEDESSIPQMISSYLSEIEWKQIGSILSIITSTIDLSTQSVQRGIDLSLDNLKKVYDNMPHLLTVYAQRQNWDMDLRIVFMAQIGYLIRVPHQTEIPENYQGDEWTLQFVKNSGQFYCNNLTKMLDEEYGDVYGEITDREKKIFLDLEAIITQSSEILQFSYWQTCQIECWLGVARIRQGMCTPRYSAQSLIIGGGWHLLLGQDAIDNNGFSFNHSNGPVHRVYNSEENLVNTHYSNRIMVISGPNGSGKTIYMKQTALIIFLAHLGFHVPASIAEIPLIDKVISIEASRSIYQQVEGFEAELASLSRLTTPGLITNKSLVLIDELGSSIDAEIAQKLLATTITYLSENRKGHIAHNQIIPELMRKNNFSTEAAEFQIPLSLIVTHLTDVMRRDMISEEETKRYLTMDMEKGEVKLYKIKPGLVKKGYGIDCARSYMSETFIKRAEQFWSKILSERQTQLYQT